jgi:hypothetical protein
LPKDPCETLADLIGDYRAGEDIVAMDAAHVDRWIRQFPADVRDPILAELIHVFDKTYVPREFADGFIAKLVVRPDFAGPNPTDFWKGVKVLSLQTAGNSQKHLVGLLTESLRTQCGLKLKDCGADPHTYLYLDDGLFSGGRILSDLRTWIADEAPAHAKIVIWTMASHRFGKYSIDKDLKAAATKAGKAITFEWHWEAMFEDRKSETNDSDVLRPTTVPADKATQDYVDGLKKEPIVRTVGGESPLGIFTGEPGRRLLEQQFLVQGVRVLQMCPYLAEKEFMRPLGASLFPSFGFGTMLVTYRNCPNNAPLVLWAGYPWYPLFPRKTN